MRARLAGKPASTRENDSKNASAFDNAVGVDHRRSLLTAADDVDKRVTQQPFCSPTTEYTASHLSLVAQNQTVSDKTKRGIKLCIDVHPGSDGNCFRSQTADEILGLLVDAHETEFRIPELVAETGSARSTVWRAIDLLDELGAIRIRETPQRSYVSIDPERLQKDDPVLAIEQPEFHEPIRAFVDRVQAAIEDAEEIDELVGIVVFGSVACGTADRKSDIDLFVVVEGDRTSARRTVTGVVETLAEQRFGGDRFAFEPYVESTASARRASGKLREIFSGGITIYGTDQLHSIRKAVISNE